MSDEERRRVYDAAWAKGGFHFWVATFRDILTNEAANRTAYDYWRDRTRERVDDPAVAAILAPTEPRHRSARSARHSNRATTSASTRTTSISSTCRQPRWRRSRRTGVRTSAGEVALDVLVLATGFDANTGGLTAIDIRGTGGRSLADAWTDGVDTHLGVAVSGFPNMLMLYGPQSAASFCNGPVCAELQGEWLVDLLTKMRSDGDTMVDAEPGTGPAWTAHLAELADSTLFGRADSWYMGANIPGKRRQLLNYPNSDAYLDHLARCADDGWAGFAFAR